MIPKFSAPLTKLIRTGEGIVLFAFNVATLVLATVGDVAPSVAVKYAAIFNAVAFGSRQALKAVAVLQPSVGTPIPVQLGTHSEADILAEIQAAADAAEEFQSKPGTPLAALDHGLTPDAPPIDVPAA